MTASRYPLEVLEFAKVRDLLGRFLISPLGRASLDGLVPFDTPEKMAHALAQETNGYIYGENENGGTNTIYVSPVPFEELNEAIEKGKGKPHLNPVKDTMAQANNLAAAMFVAPIAGIAAAVGKYYKRTK